MLDMSRHDVEEELAAPGQPAGDLPKVLSQVMQAIACQYPLALDAPRGP